jgi:hypothetical protein
MRARELVRALHASLVWWLAGTLAVVAAVSLTRGVQGQEQALPAPEPSATAMRTAIVAAQQVALQTGRSVPVGLRIPAIGLAVTLGSLGLNADGTVQVPSGADQPGWFRLGPTPGQIGSAAILGHVDSQRGPGVFFQLRTLAAGDQVDVDLANGITARFTVNEVATYPKQEFPAQRVYGSHGSSALQLVTCGGVFDSQTGSYLSNVVVYSSLTALLPARTAALGSAQPST